MTDIFWLDEGMDDWVNLSIWDALYNADLLTTTILLVLAPESEIPRGLADGLVTEKS